MNISVRSVPVSRGKWPRSLIIRTTLYDLIAAINGEVGGDEDDLTIAAVAHLLRTHRLTYLGTSKPRRLVTDQSQTIGRRRKAASTARRGWIASSGCRALPSWAWSSARPLPSIHHQRPPANA
jgi:hypothetical protein